MEEGNIFFSEEHGYRFLHFGNEDIIQGGMRVKEPWVLSMEYQQAMAILLLLFGGEPKRTLHLGLGPGSLAKYCWKFFPEARTTVVEISEEVYQAARMWFKMPADDERLETVFQDCKKYLKKNAADIQADWMFIDIYDAETWGPVYDDVSFYKLCRKALSPNGLAAVNVFGGEDFEQSLANISKAFDGRVLGTWQMRSGNHVILAANGPKKEWKIADLTERAREINKPYHLPSILFTKRLCSRLLDEQGKKKGDSFIF